MNAYDCPFPLLISWFKFIDHFLTPLCARPSPPRARTFRQKEFWDYGDFSPYLKEHSHDKDIFKRHNRLFINHDCVILVHNQSNTPSYGFSLLTTRPNGVTVIPLLQD